MRELLRDTRSTDSPPERRVTVPARPHQPQTDAGYGEGAARRRGTTGGGRAMAVSAERREPTQRAAGSRLPTKPKRPRSGAPVVPVTPPVQRPQPVEEVVVETRAG